MKVCSDRRKVNRETGIWKIMIKIRKHLFSCKDGGTVG